MTSLGTVLLCQPDGHMSHPNTWFMEHLPLPLRYLMQEDGCFIYDHAVVLPFTLVPKGGVVGPFSIVGGGTSATPQVTTDVFENPIAPCRIGSTFFGDILPYLDAAGPLSRSAGVSALPQGIAAAYRLKT